MGLWNNIKSSFKNTDNYSLNTALYGGGAAAWGVMTALGATAIITSGGTLAPVMMPTVLASSVAAMGCIAGAYKAHEAGSVDKSAKSAGVVRNDQDNRKQSFRDKWKQFDKSDKVGIALYAAEAMFFAAGAVAMGVMSAPLATVCAYIVGATGMGQAATYARDIAENNVKIKAAEKAGQAGLTKQKENSKTRTRENTNHITMEPQLHTSEDVRKKMSQNGKAPALSPVKVNTRAFDFDFMNSQNQGGRKL